MNDNIWEQICNNTFNYNEYRNECEQNTGRKLTEQALMVEMCRNILNDVSMDLTL